MTNAKRERLYQVVIAVLLLVIAGMAYKFIVAGSTAKGADGRTAVLLEPGERAFVLREMRGLLVGVQRMTDALSRDDMQGVAQAARALGGAKADDAPVSLVGKLPLEFKKLAFGVHGDFDAIAAEAERSGQSKRTLAQVSAVLQKCTACHEQYQFGEGRGR